MEKEVTYYKFLSEIRNFLSKLISKPLDTEISTFFKEHDFNKDKLIRVLIKRGILKRKESIKDKTNSEETTTKYYVKYSIVKEGFEEKVKKMYNEYFKKTIKESMSKTIILTEKQMQYIAEHYNIDYKLLTEEGEGGAIGGATTTFSVGSDTTRGDMGYDVPAFGKSKNKNRKEKGTDSDFFKSSIVRKPGFTMERLK